MMDSGTVGRESALAVTILVHQQSYTPRFWDLSTSPSDEADYRSKAAALIEEFSALGAHVCSFCTDGASAQKAGLSILPDTLTTTLPIRPT